MQGGAEGCLGLLVLLVPLVDVFEEDWVVQQPVQVVELEMLVDVENWQREQQVQPAMLIQVKIQQCASCKGETAKH